MTQATELIAKQMAAGAANARVWADILYNVKLYGAKGDWNGTTGTDDTVSVQATIDAAIAAGGRAVFFPHGTYKVTALTNLSSVVLFGDNASFVGILTTINQIGADLPSFETATRTVYVSVNTGNDTSGNGSVALPYKTITKALSTIKKNISAAVKVRVLAGNYTLEGAISVKSFSGTSLTITAFDGTNDVTAPSDSYSLESMACYDCSVLYIQGVKCIPSSPNYGIFVSACTFVNIVGYKIDLSGNSGVGVTGNSFVWINGCTALNQNTVISSNQGGTAVSQNWISSTGNVTALVVNTGAKIHMFDDVQPTATNPYDKKNGGVIFDKNGNPILTNAVQQVFFQRDVTLTPNFDIPISLSQPPKWIKVSACITGTVLSSEGQWGENATQFCIYTTNTNTKNGAFKFALFTDAGGTIDYTVVSVAKDKITLSRSMTGTLAGNMNMAILCGI